MSQDSPLRKEPRFRIIDRNTVLATWDGQPTTLLPTQNVNMPQTTNGSMILAYRNASTENNQGTLSLTSGASAPVMLQAFALTLQPSLETNNWKGNNLSVTNISANANTPIWIQAVGPGLPGQTPVNLPNNGTQVALAPGQTAQGQALPQYMNLVLGNSSSQLTIMALIGGPPDASGNNAFVIAINSTAGNTGPGTGVPAPAGYYATTSGNQYFFQFNWSAATLFLANMSASNASAGTVSLYPL